MVRMHSLLQLIRFETIYKSICFTEYTYCYMVYSIFSNLLSY